MAENQPKWKCSAQLGDQDPVSYGGYFVLVDETGVYPPEAELLQSPDDDSGTPREGWTAYRFVLERCTFIDGVLSANKYHPHHSVWFCPSAVRRAERPQDSHLGQVADSQGTSEAELIAQFCSEDPIERAHAYRAVGEHHGFDNFDSYPLQFTTRAEVEARYNTAKYEVQSHG